MNQPVRITLLVAAQRQQVAPASGPLQPLLAGGPARVARRQPPVFDRRGPYENLPPQFRSREFP